MGKYILKRVAAGLVTIFVLITITFFLMHAIPGGPFSPQEEKKTPKFVLEILNERYGLNKPVWEQYLLYLRNLIQGDFGASYKRAGISVNRLLDVGFPISASVGGLTIAVALGLGVPLGVASSVKRGKWPDYASMVFATVGISAPPFVISVTLLYLFSMHLKWLPSLGLTSWRHYILPVACLAFQPIAYIARQVRSSMLDALQQDYTRTARAKGVSEGMVIWKHALKNSILPVVTYLGPLVAALLTGSFIVERLFSIPGIGRDYVASVGDRDYTLIMGMTAFFGIFVIVCNIIVDICYALIDPRVKLTD
ncbi:MAG: ABC transporter permease [Oscillospiraceae bacterium]|nr:ABC transporter permease [Oscillospiraceae bacterium]